MKQEEEKPPASLELGTFDEESGESISYLKSNAQE